MDSAVTRLIRDAANDPDVVKALAASEYRKLVQHGRLVPQAIWFVLGIAAAVTLEANLGRASASVLAAVQTKAEAEAQAATLSERQRSEAETPAAGGRIAAVSSEFDPLRADAPALT